MTFNEAKKILLLICLGDNELFSYLHHADDIVNRYTQELYGVRHGSYYRHLMSGSNDERRAIAQKLLGRLDTYEKAMPNIVKSGINYHYATVGKPNVSVPASIRDLT